MQITSPSLQSILLAALLAFPVPLQAGASILEQFSTGLGHRLSANASIQPGSSAPPRWSKYDAPTGAVVVNVAVEDDVAQTVKYCNEHNIPFLAQNGGNGWSIEFHMNGTGAIINLAGLNEFTPNADKSNTTIGGGIKINESTAATWATEVEIVTGNCPCVGVLGATLGGGFGYLMGLHGMSSDNVLSVNLVTPQGDLKTVTADSDADLFWALRGAGPNFGIVTSAVVRSWPASHDTMFAWSAEVVYDQAHLEDVVQAINDLSLTGPTSVFLAFYSVDGKPVLAATPFYYQGNETIGKQAFASLYSIPHVNETSSIIPSNHFTDGSAFDCERGYYKPSAGVATARMDPVAYRNIWNEFVKFQALPGSSSTNVVVECYSWTVSRSIPLDKRGSFPHRDYASFYPILQAWYNDTKYEKQALALTAYARDQWRASSGIEGRNASYINFARGDEKLDVIYGDSLPRLRNLKKQVDPSGRMNQWYPIK